jgi:ketosteroid isomerase-like protein
MRLLLCCSILFLATPILAIAQDDVAIVKRQAQEFSDASGSGDATTLEKYLDDNVVFMNEGGDIATKHDLVSSAKPAPAGMSNKLTISDFDIKLEGDIAVTSFTDNSTFTAYGQTYRAAYKSIEVWRKKHGNWLMISSQTLAVPVDPPSVRQSNAELDEYVGTYQAGPNLSVKIERAGKGLVSSTNGGSATDLLVEVPNVLFTPGQPRQRRVFQRDASGKISGFVSRREGHDLFHFLRVG